MAKGSFDNNRDGIDDNIDRRPGNSDFTAAYSKIYDPRNEKEFSNSLEPQNELEEREIERVLRANMEAEEVMKAAQADVHFFPDIGKFIIPAENTWAAHVQLVEDDNTRLKFSPEKYQFFDKIVADKLKLAALTDEKHKDYAKYEPLRTNLEVLRNDIIGMYLSDGGFDPGDEVYVPLITGIANVLGDALANDTPIKRPFTKHMSLDVANVEAVGAAEMYKFLLEGQDKNPLFTAGIFRPLMRSIRETMGLPERNWGLLPLEHTPFSPEALSAPPPKMGTLVGDKIAPAQSAPVSLDCNTLLTTAKKFHDVADLNVSAKANSVEEARKILRGLKNLQFGELDVQDWLSTGTPPEQIAKAEALSKLVMIYAGQLTNAKTDAPYLLANHDVKEGSDAAGACAIMIGEHALSMLTEGSAEYQKLEQLLDSMPQEQNLRTGQSTTRLLALIETGLTHIAGKTLDSRTPVETLIEMRNRIQAHAKQLRSVDTLEIPAREESVELGREILRKLRGLSFSNRPVEEMIDSGKPEEKAAIAQKIEEMVELYKNMLAEASINNPDIINDARVKEANDAVDNFGHIISLMAAKEMPNSVATSMQISADATHDPHEWKNLLERTVDRLLVGIEGGLEKAVDSIDAHEQQQQKQDEEMAQEVIDAALQQADTAKRGKKRRRSQQSGYGMKKQQRLQRDLSADDAAAKQNRFAEVKEEKQASYMGLNAKDMAAIKNLGATLNKIGKQGKATVTPANISMSSTVAPNDKTAAELAIESIKSTKRNNHLRGS